MGAAGIERLSAQPTGATLANLESGDLVYVPNVFPDTRAVASDGSVLTSAGIWKGGHTTPMMLPSQIQGIGTAPALSDDASAVVFVNNTPGRYQLIAREVASGGELVVSDSYTGAGLPSSTLSLSAT